MSAERQPFNGSLSIVVVLMLYANWAFDYYKAAPTFSHGFVVFAVGLTVLQVSGSIYRDRIA